jgi:uncharacterized phage protein gp47/JayE
MAWNRPTLGQIIARVEADIVGALGIVGALVSRTVEYILARALAGLSHEMHGRIEYLANRAVPWNAEGDDLRGWCALFGVVPKPAEWASGAMDLTGAPGAVVPAGTVFVRADGARFASGLSATIGGAGLGVVGVTAEVAGAAGNTPMGAPFTIFAPVAGLSSAVSGTLAGGADAETDQELFTRLQQRIANPPQGGSKDDYERWALEVPGVTRAWAYPLKDVNGADEDGRVTVRFVRDNDSSIFPDAGEVAAVLAYITAPYRAPAGAKVSVAAPAQAVWNFSISITPNTAETRAAVEANVREFFARESEPGVALPRSKYLEAVSLATGVLDSAVTAPAGNIPASPGTLAVPGTFTFSTL